MFVCIQSLTFLVRIKKSKWLHKLLLLQSDSFEVGNVVLVIGNSPKNKPVFLRTQFLVFFVPATIFGNRIIILSKLINKRLKVLLQPNT